MSSTGSIAGMTITCAISPDGSITITAGTFSLVSGYPAIDGVAIRAVSIEVTADAVRWMFADGKRLEMRVSHHHDALELRTSLHGWTIARI